MRSTQVLRTPQENFEALPGYSFSTLRLENVPGYEGLSLAYLDEGPKDSKDIFLCLHGQPTWSYLYRKMIPVFVQKGIRVVAPDFFGFGQSDKPVDDEVYTFNFHRNLLIALIEKLELTNITLVCQDWGGLLGLTLPMEMPSLFTRLLIMNTGFGIGKVNEAFLQWRDFNRKHDFLHVDRLMQKWEPSIRQEEASAYSAPFPNGRYCAGVRRFPDLVPTSSDDPIAKLSQQALAWWKTSWSGDSFMAIGMKDPILGPDVMLPMSKVIANCPPPLCLSQAGHFVQEHGEQVAKAALESFGFSSL